MNKKQLITLFILAFDFQPMIMASDDDPIANQVNQEIRNSLCFRIATCQLRPYEEQYDYLSNPYENCDTPRNAAQTTLRFITCPLMVVGIITCVPVCVDCYISHRIKQIHRENLERNFMNMNNSHLPQAALTSLTSYPQATVINYNNMPVATVVKMNSLHNLGPSIIAVRIQDDQI